MQYSRFALGFGRHAEDLLSDLEGRLGMMDDGHCYRRQWMERALCQKIDAPNLLRCALEYVHRAPGQQALAVSLRTRPRACRLATIWSTFYLLFSDQL